MAVRAALRRADDAVTGAEETATIGEMGPHTAWADAVDGIDVVVHLAARVHVMRERAVDPTAEFRRVNVAGTERLAEAAARAGVRRLVYVSSIKVNGERTGDAPFRPDDRPAPEDAYGRSKWEAERALRAVATATGLEAVVVRPPLVHGPEVRGNLLRLLALLDRGLPLPLGAVRNRRSLVGVDNLADFLARATTHPAAAGRTFLVGDPDDLSTPELLRQLSAGLGRPARLLPLPVRLLRLSARAAGQIDALSRLVESLEVDSSSTRLLDWVTPVSTADGLARMAAWYRATHPRPGGGR